jgi:hypothetical protein
VVLCSDPTAGHGVALPFNPMRPEIVLIAVTPVAPPWCAAFAISRISEENTFAIVH